MSQLVILRQRIKAIETVKKTTNAMRLIAMSTHSRLRHHKEQFQVYRNALHTLMAQIPAQSLQKEARSEHLVIIVGSQKGLCGIYNTSLVKYFNQLILPQPFKLMVIGRQIYEILNAQKTLIDSYQLQFSIQSYHTIAFQIAQTILHNNYKAVYIISQEAKTFFLQKPRMTQVWPVATQTTTESSDELIFEENPQELYQHLLQAYIVTQLDTFFFESLLAEQAARFLSMDNATHNADSLLTSMKLDYNKLRQALITRELADLSGSLI